MTIFIGNLSWDAEREDLVHLFSQYGEVSKCSLPLDRETGRKRGFAFVDLANAADEKSAIDDLQDVEWMGTRDHSSSGRTPPLISARLNVQRSPITSSQLISWGEVLC